MEEDIKEILTALDNTTKKQLDEAIANADKEWSEMELEEDIKILEDLFYDDESFEPNGYVEIFLHKNEQEAIKHLIARNKELEEKNEQYKSKNYELQREIKDIKGYTADEIILLKEEAYYKGRSDENINYKNYVENNYIPKSKLRELLKEIDEANLDGSWWYENKIKELLGEEE